VADLPDGYVYDMGPNTDRWVGWQSPTDAAGQGKAGFQEDWQQDIDAVVEHAKEQFRARTGWEGDVREGPFIAGLMPPEDGKEFTFAVAIKQDNNGWIYVWSPYELGWLAQHQR
jgi:hypothetical protein